MNQASDLLFFHWILSLSQRYDKISKSWRGIFQNRISLANKDPTDVKTKPLRVQNVNAETIKLYTTVELYIFLRYILIIHNALTESRVHTWKRTSCSRSANKLLQVCSQAVDKLCSHCLFPVAVTSLEQAVNNL
jgi:hypothetical protein